LNCGMFINYRLLTGHSDIETTMIYSHLTEDHVNNAVDKLNF